MFTLLDKLGFVGMVMLFELKVGKLVDLIDKLANDGMIKSFKIEKVNQGYIESFNWILPH